MSTPSPDAALIALCGEVETAERSLRALRCRTPAEEAKTERERHRLAAHISGLLGRIRTMPSTTPAGAQAIARVVLAVGDGGNLPMVEGLAMGALRFMAGEVAA